MNSNLSEIMVCPTCRATKNEGFSIETLKCGHCGNEFFELDDILCCFPSGMSQKSMWQHLLTVVQENHERAMDSLQQEFSLSSLSDATRERLSSTGELLEYRVKEVIDLFKAADLVPTKHQQFDGYSAVSLFDYHDHLLRDWAWYNQEASDVNEQKDIDENRVTFERVHNALLNTLADSDDFSSKRILVLGAGAGRLSWDLHCALKPKTTVALDFNPLLSLVSKRLIHDGQTLTSVELSNFPKKGLPKLHHWQLQCDSRDPADVEGWIPLLADAWSIPFAPDSFDLVITPWFIDINGRDVKDLIPLIEDVLKPGGLWLNDGPFLYREETPENEKYTGDEIIEFLNLSQFEVLSSDFDTNLYLKSPLSRRGSLEECWCFIARAPMNNKHLLHGGEFKPTITESEVHPCFIMKHLPVPYINPELFPVELRNFAALIDGTRSMRELEYIVTNLYPDNAEDVDLMIYDMIDEFVLSKKQSIILTP